MGKANLLAVVLMSPLVGGLAALFAARWDWALVGHGLWEFFDVRVAVPSAVLGIIAHEAIHAISWAVASRRPLSAIAVGIQWRSLTPYAHPRDPMGVQPYRIGAAMPGLVLGIVPAVAAIVLGRPILLAFGLLFTIAAGGDALVLWLIRRVSPTKSVQDHPTRAGCIVLE
jgi:hypothetical protein